MSCAPDSAKDDAPEAFVIEHILDRRERKPGRVEYLIKWYGYSRKHNSWIAASNIFDRRFVDEYERAREEALANASAKAAGLGFVWPPPNPTDNVLRAHTLASEGLRQAPLPKAGKRANLDDSIKAVAKEEARRTDVGQSSGAGSSQEIDAPLKRFRLGDCAVLDGVQRPRLVPTGPLTKRQQSMEEKGHKQAAELLVASELAALDELQRRQKKEVAQPIACDHAASTSGMPKCPSRAGAEPLALRRLVVTDESVATKAIDPPPSKSLRLADVDEEMRPDAPDQDRSAPVPLRAYYPCGGPKRPDGLQCVAWMHCASANCSKGRPPHNTCQSRRLGPTAIGWCVKVRSPSSDEGSRTAVVTSWDPALGTHELLYSEPGSDGKLIETRVCLGSTRVQIDEQASLPATLDGETCQRGESSVGIAAAAMVSATTSLPYRFVCSCGVAFDHGSAFWSSAREMVAELGSDKVTQCVLCAAYVHKACAAGNADLTSLGVAVATTTADDACGGGKSQSTLCGDCMDLASDAMCCARLQNGPSTCTKSAPAQYEAAGQVRHAVLAPMETVTCSKSTLADCDGLSAETAILLDEHSPSGVGQRHIVKNALEGNVVNGVSERPPDVQAFTCGLCWSCEGARRGAQMPRPCVWRPDGDYTFCAVIIEGETAPRNAAALCAVMVRATTRSPATASDRGLDGSAGRVRGIVHACTPVDVPHLAGALGLGCRSNWAGAKSPRLVTRPPIRARVHFDNGFVEWLSEAELLRFARSPRPELAYSSLAARQLSHRPPFNMSAFEPTSRCAPYSCALDHSDALAFARTLTA